MSSYERSTRECKVSQIPHEPLQAIRDFFQKHNLGDPERETLACCETITEKKKTSKLLTWLEGEQDMLIHTWMLLTSKWLVWVRRGDRTGMVSNAANLTQVRAKEYKSIFSRDSGLELFGYIGESKGRVRGYIGMGTEPVAQEFREQVMKAIVDMKPASSKRGWFRWFSR
jgi:hypothetical protein